MALRGPKREPDAAGGGRGTPAAIVTRSESRVPAAQARPLHGSAPISRPLVEELDRLRADVHAAQREAEACYDAVLAATRETTALEDELAVAKAHALRAAAWRLANVVATRKRSQRDAAFHAWQRATSRRAQARAAGGFIAAQARRRAARLALHAWLATARVRHQQRAALQELLRTCRRRQCRIAMAVWRAAAFAALQARGAAAAQAADASAARCVALQAQLDAAAAELVELRQATDAADAAVGVKSARRASLTRWKHAAWRSVAVRSMSHRRARASIRAAWTAWRGLLLQCLQQRIVLQSAVQHWRMVAIRRRQAAAAEAMALLAPAFHAWRRATTAAQCRLRLVCKVIDSRSQAKRRRLQAAVLRSWREAVDRMHAAKRLAVAQSVQSVAAAVHAWRNVARVAAAARELQAHRRQRRLQQAWTGWRAGVTQRQQVLGSRAAIMIRLQSAWQLRRSICAWRDVMHDDDARIEHWQRQLATARRRQSMLAWHQLAQGRNAQRVHAVTQMTVVLTRLCVERGWRRWVVGMRSHRAQQRLVARRRLSLLLVAWTGWAMQHQQLGQRHGLLAGVLGAWRCHATRQRHVQALVQRQATAWRVSRARRCLQQALCAWRVHLLDAQWASRTLAHIRRAWEIRRLRTAVTVWAAHNRDRRLQQQARSEAVTLQDTRAAAFAARLSSRRLASALASWRSAARCAHKLKRLSATAAWHAAAQVRWSQLRVLQAWRLSLHIRQSRRHRLRAALQVLTASGKPALRLPMALQKWRLAASLASLAEVNVGSVATAISGMASATTVHELFSMLYSSVATTMPGTCASLWVACPSSATLWSMTCDAGAHQPMVTSRDDEGIVGTALAAARRGMGGAEAIAHPNAPHHPHYSPRVDYAVVAAISPATTGRATGATSPAVRVRLLSLCSNVADAALEPPCDVRLSPPAARTPRDHKTCCAHRPIGIVEYATTQPGGWAPHQQHLQSMLASCVSLVLTRLLDGAHCRSQVQSLARRLAAARDEMATAASAMQDMHETAVSAVHGLQAAVEERDGLRDLLTHSAEDAQSAAQCVPAADQAGLAGGHHDR